MYKNDYRKPENWDEEHEDELFIHELKLSLDNSAFLSE